MSYLDGTRGVAYGIVEGSSLSAVSLLRLPNENHPNVGLPFPLVPDEDWLHYACFLENTMVLPAARGHGYQKILLDARRSHAGSAKMRWLCAGVHLENSVSWANLLAKGMSIVGIRFDLGYPVIGLLNALDAPALTSASSDRLSVSTHEPSQHEAALQKGYIGVRLAADDAVIYQRLTARRVEDRTPTLSRTEQDFLRQSVTAGADGVLGE